MGQALVLINIRVLSDNGFRLIGTTAGLDRIRHEAGRLEGGLVNCKTRTRILGYYHQRLLARSCCCTIRRTTGDLYRQIEAVDKLDLSKAELFRGTFDLGSPCLTLGTLRARSRHGRRGKLGRLLGNIVRLIQGPASRRLEVR